LYYGALLASTEISVESFACPSSIRLGIWEGGALKEVKELIFEEYIKGVVYAEMRGFTEIEALKAQAVAARTYALKHLGKHASEGYDVCNRPACCQAWSPPPPGGYPPVVNDAVESTRGEVITFAGSLIDATFFSSSRTHYTRNAEEVWPNYCEYRRKTLTPEDVSIGFGGHGVGMSQYGAKELANAGLNYVEILKHYYGPVPPYVERVKIFQGAELKYEAHWEDNNDYPIPTRKFVIDTDLPVSIGQDIVIEIHFSERVDWKKAKVTVGAEEASYVLGSLVEGANPPTKLSFKLTKEQLARLGVGQHKIIISARHKFASEWDLDANPATFCYQNPDADHLENYEEGSDGNHFLTIPPPSIPVDVYLIVDLSASFSDDLPYFKSQASTMIYALRLVYPNIRFGLGAFEDYPIEPFGNAWCGDRAYYRILNLTFNADALINTIMSLDTKCGGDAPESQLAALYQAATGKGQDLSRVGYPGASIPPGQQASFRRNACKLIVLWTDAPFHRPGDPGDLPYPGPSFEETINALLAVDPVKVIGISSGTAALPDLKEVAMGTGALAPPGGVDWNGDGVVDILEGEPLVCSIPPTGEGIADAIVATVKAVAKFEYSNLIVTPKRVSPGEEVKASVTVKNVGTSAGTETVSLFIDGKVKDTQTITLGPEEVQEITFVFSFTTSEIGAHIVTINGLDPVEVEVLGDTTGPPAPVISSPTHPDQNKWYLNNDPVFTWTEPEDPSGIAGYSYVLDREPSTLPDTTIDTTERTKSYEDLPDGTWYFHVRAVDGAGNWGPAGHYRINIGSPPSPPVGPVITLIAQITWPTDGAFVRAAIAIMGTASGGTFDHYTIEYGTGRNPSNWVLIYSSTNSVTTGTLATWDTATVLDGEYTIRLSVFDSHGNSQTAQVVVFIDNTPPAIHDLLPVEGDFATSMPTISATLTDNLSGIDEGTIVVKLNGVPVDPPPSFDPKTGKLTWAAQHPLGEGTYQVSIDVKDRAGNSAPQAKTTFVVSSKLMINKVLNYPNPCSSGTTFTYNLSQPAYVRIEIYTLAGELIKVIEPASGNVGYNEQYWDGSDERGRPLGNGVYVYRIVARAGNETVQAIGKLMVLR